MLPSSPVAVSRLDSRRKSTTELLPASTIPEPPADTPLPSMSTPFQQLNVSTEVQSPNPHGQICQPAADSPALQAESHQLPLASSDYARQSTPCDSSPPAYALKSSSARQSAAFIDSSVTQPSPERSNPAPGLSPVSRRRVSELSPEPGGLDVEAFLPPSLSPRPASSHTNNRLPVVLQQCYTTHEKEVTAFAFLSSQHGVAHSCIAPVS